MSRNHLKRIVLCAAAGVCVLLVFVGLLFVIERERTQSETGAVLSAFFSQEVLHDMDNWRGERTVAIVILRHPGCLACSRDNNDFNGQFWFTPSLRSRRKTLSDAWFAQSSRITRASFFVNSVFSTDISTDVRLPSGAQVVFADTTDVRTRTNELAVKFPNNLGYFVVSHVGLNLNRTEALLYVDHFCGGLCGGGDYFLMRKTNGVWRVVDRHFVWVS